MMLILGKTSTPRDLASASKLPEPNVERDIVFKHPDARTAAGNSFKL